MCWASLTTSQLAYSSCFPDIFMFLKESDVDCCHIAFSKKKLYVWGSDLKNGGRIKEGGKWINNGKVKKRLYFQKLFLDFRKLDEKCNILIFMFLAFFLT